MNSDALRRAADAFVILCLLGLLLLALCEAWPSPVAMEPQKNCREAGLCDSDACNVEPGACTGCCHPSKCACADSPTTCGQ